MQEEPAGLISNCVPAGTELPHDVHGKLAEARQAMLRVPPARDCTLSIVTVVVSV